ncbi:MAG TPA: pyruvate kinase, partial [Candidatus Aphodoplasma excrementigallinarum]|nr:pyruvate kinase [Candidatus Aphodoplasma excrementigallinarum]
VAASFTRNASDILSIKKILEDNGSDMRIIAKIENFEGIENIDEIIKVSDGIMVARGDMGVEIPFEEIPALQKMIVKKTMVSGKPAITATQMLESMIQNPRPTRAEITDVANAIYDGTSAIMLSGETAVGKYPVEAVSTMARIAKRTEEDINYIERFSENDYNANVNITTAISHATCSAAHDLGAAAIITLTISGTTARMISKYRPACPIIGCTSREKTMRFMCLSWGVIPVFLENMEDSGELFERAVDIALEQGYVKSGEMVVISAGLPLGIQGTTNILKVEIAGHVLIRAKGSGQKPLSAPVCVCKSAKEAAKKFNDGDILVIHDTNNDLLPIIKRASGLVIEAASSASHGVTVGLTLDIPVIYAANNATDILKCGSIVTLDPTGGVVYSGTVKVGQ